MATLVLADDDKEVLEINGKFLSTEGFNVFTISNPLKCVDLVKAKKPDCIVLDVMMPGLDGFELCRQIRRFSDVPIIFLTGKSTEDDKINGLMTGADDYIVKPYSLKELKARIDVVLRRARRASAHAAAPAPASHILNIGDLTIDKLAHKAIFLNEDLNLTGREYSALLYLAEHPGREISFEELGEALLGHYEELDRRVIMVIVSRLRKKMKDDPELENMIETVWSKGYKFTRGSF